MVPGWLSELLPEVVVWEPLRGGYTRSQKWRVRLRDGSRAFVKAATEDRLLEMLRREFVVLGGVRAAFLPEVLALHDHGDRAVLVVEDLSDAHWPPPYPDDLSPLLVALDAVAAVPTPASLPRLNEDRPCSWARIDPTAVVALGVCTRVWLENALPVLVEAESRFQRAGDGLVHNDVWCANLCFTDRGCVFVDWASAAVGNPRIDLAHALLDVRVEHGNAPRGDDDAVLAAYVAGSRALGATSPLPKWATADSTLRTDQAADLAVALKWAAEALELPAP